MPAYLALEDLPEGVEVIGLDRDGRFPLDPDVPVVIGRASFCHIRVKGALIGGRQNCRFMCRPDGQWIVEHMGHSIPVIVNDTPLEGPRSAELHDGDIIRPLTNSPDPGPSFRFVIES